MDGKTLVYNFDEDCSHRLGLGASADEIHVAQCKACGKMTTASAVLRSPGKCGNCGEPVSEGQVMTLADHWEQELRAILWDGGEA